MKPDNTVVLSRIKNLVREIDPTADVILYGSRARGDEHPESDWDLLILLDQKNVDKKIEQTFRHHLFDLELEIGVPISVFAYSKQDWEGKYSITPLFNSIKKDGILIS
jgi:uncharacterized protein